MSKRQGVLGMVISLAVVGLMLITTSGCDSAGAGGAGGGGAPGGGTGDYVSPNIGTLKYVPAGSFQRDTNAVNISVISKPFRMSQYEITRQQFYAIMGTDPSDTSRSSNPTITSDVTVMTDPVQQVSWYHVLAFCNKLSLIEGLDPVYSVTKGDSEVDWATLLFENIPISQDSDWDSAVCDWGGNGYRLPTETEWMWAAMGATSGYDYSPNGVYTTGYQKDYAGQDPEADEYSAVSKKDASHVGDYAWFAVNSDHNDDGQQTTQPVGTKAANELGLHDMSGNVLEWCWDWWTGESGSLPGTGEIVDSRGPATGLFRILRGGSYLSPAQRWNPRVSVFHRSGQGPNYRYGTEYGFRVVRK